MILPSAVAAAPAVPLAAICPPRPGGAEGAAAALAAGGTGSFRLPAPERLPPALGPTEVEPAALRGDARLAALMDGAPAAPPWRLHVLRDVLLLPEAGLVLHEGRAVLETIPAWRRADLAGFLAAPRFADAWRAGIAHEAEAPVLAVWNAPARNYAHWHFDSLGALTMAREALGPGPSIFAPARRTRFQSESLGLLPSALAAVATPVAGLVRCRTLVWPSPLEVSVTPTPQAGRAFDALRAAVLAEEPAPLGGPRVYVARFDAPGRRTIENEAALADALAARGFDIVTPGLLGYREQVARFAAARVIVGPHGAGLTNAGFAAPGALVVELHPASYGGAAYRRLSMLRGLRWRGWLMAEGSGTGHAVRCEVDVPALLAQLDAWGAFA